MGDTLYMDSLSAIANYKAARSAQKTAEIAMYLALENDLMQANPSLVVVCKRGRTGAVRMEFYPRSRLAE